MTTIHASAPAATATRQRLIERITACWRTQAIHVAVQMDLPDLLAPGPTDVATLSRTCGSAPDALQRLLRALCTLEICRELGDGRFALLPAGELLRREPADSTAGLRAMALWWGGPLWPLWGDLAYSVQTGRSARKRQTGQASYGFLETGTDAATVFHDAMRALTAMIAEEVARHDTWQGIHTLVDVGGGHGELTTAILASHQTLRATVLDRADAEVGALALFRQRRLTRRARFVVGDFFVAVPPDADRYLLKSILHNWDDEACQRILARCAEAAPQGAHLVIVERLRPGRSRATRHDEAVARTDLNMLAGLGGRERSLAEFTALLEPARFTVLGVKPTGHEFSIIEAQRC